MPEPENYESILVQFTRDGVVRAESTMQYTAELHHFVLETSNQTGRIDPSESLNCQDVTNTLVLFLEKSAKDES